jgi:hypothetical protein
MIPNLDGYSERWQDRDALHCGSYAAREDDGYRFRLRSLSYGGQAVPPILRVLLSSFSDVQLHIVGVRSTSPESILRQSVRAYGFSDVQLHIIVRAKRRAPE